VCMTVYKWAATAALREGDLQRFFRDMHAGTQHMTSGPVVLQACGRMLTGLAKDAEWVFFSLVEKGGKR
jgi:indole-3-acetate monooxygenase